MTSGITGEETLVPPISDQPATWNVIVQASLPRAERGELTILLETAPADDRSRALAEVRGRYQIAYDTPGGDAKQYEITIVGYCSAAEAAKLAGDDTLAAEATYQCARIHDARGDTPDAIEWQLRALELFRALGRRDREARVLNRLGDLSRKVGEVRDAQKYFEAALPLAREMRDPAAATDILNNSGLLMSTTGRWEEAIEQLDDAIPLAQEIEAADIEASLAQNTGDAWSRLGLNDKALQSYRRSLEVKRAHNAPPHRVLPTLRAISVAHFQKGERTKAEEAMRSALELAERASDRSGIAHTVAVHGMMQHARGDDDLALQSLGRALPMLRERQNRGVQVDVLNTLAEIDIDRAQLERPCRRQRRRWISRGSSPIARQKREACMSERVRCARRERSTAPSGPSPPRWPSSNKLEVRSSAASCARRIWPRCGATSISTSSCSSRTARPRRPSRSVSARARERCWRRSRSRARRSARESTPSFSEDCGTSRQS